MSVTTGMLGQGFYNRNSAPQWAATEAILPWLDNAVARIGRIDSPETIGIADFGCSEGRNSTEVMRRLISTLRLGSARPVMTIQSDLPTNDFTALLEGLRPNGRSVFGDDVYSAVLGGSMFDQLLPPRSIHLATTFNAIGFLSRRPLDRLPGYILPNGPSAARGVGKVSEAERATFAAQAAADIESFLRARAAELTIGGQLLIEVFGASQTARTCDGIYDVLNDSLLEAQGDGAVDRLRYETYYQPVYFRTLEELVAPVWGPESALSPLFDLDRAETYEVAVPFVEAYRATGDTAVYARAYTDFLRAFTEAPLRMAFSGGDSAAIADDIYGRCERLIRANPERYPFRYVSVAALLTRREDEA
ncbi:MAG: hypothetical protein AB7F41_12230 [Methylocystis sp.]|uniref:hypothetical protein n=1 Tax=Methylocystis sp. TaxID=1911079 RepID=UPI003D095A78